MHVAIVFLFCRTHSVAAIFAHAGTRITWSTFQCVQHQLLRFFNLEFLQSNRDLYLNKTKVGKHFLCGICKAEPRIYFWHNSLLCYADFHSLCSIKKTFLVMLYRDYVLFTLSHIHSFSSLPPSTPPPPPKYVHWSECLVLNCIVIFSQYLQTQTLCCVCVKVGKIRSTCFLYPMGGSQIFDHP